MTIHEPVDRSLTQAAIECRATRHWWQRQESAPTDWNPSPIFRGSKHVLHFVCVRCETWKHQAFNHLGTEPHVYYEYPEWYLRKGEGRMATEELRLWQIKQIAREKRARKNRP